MYEGLELFFSWILIIASLILIPVGAVALWGGKGKSANYGLLLLIIGLLFLLFYIVGGRYTWDGEVYGPLQWWEPVYVLLIFYGFIFLGAGILIIALGDVVGKLSGILISLIGAGAIFLYFWGTAHNWWPWGFLWKLLLGILGGIIGLGIAGGLIFATMFMTKTKVEELEEDSRRKRRKENGTEEVS